MDAYRAPTPDTLRGAQVLSTAQAEMLWRAKAAVFIDVLPQAPRPTGLPPGTIWRQKQHFDIPGSVWLADVGYGALAPVMERYFVEGLQQVTGGDPDRAVVFYCLSACWMSWNAAKRAITLGWRRVAWYPEGTDGWEAAGLPLDERTPLPRGFAGE